MSIRDTQRKSRRPRGGDERKVAIGKWAPGPMTIAKTEKSY